MSWIHDLLHSTLKASASVDLAGDKYEQAQKDYGCKAVGESSNPAPVDYLYYSRRTLAFAAANTNIRLTLPYEDVAAIYRVTCKLLEGTDVGVTVTDWTTEAEAFDGREVYIRVPAGDKSAGKVTIFAVYPGTANSGAYEVTVERTAETDAYTGEIQVDFAAAS